MYGNGARPTLLCVDDESSIRTALRRACIDEPWDMLFAGSGPDGLEIVLRHDLDIVLSDVCMPGMDGIEFLGRVKQAQPHCTCLVLSGTADLKVAVSALNDGKIYRFITKPWTEAELLTTLRGALRHNRLERENRKLRQDLEGAVAERVQEVLEENRLLKTAATILELLPSALVAVDRGGTIVFANARAIEMFDPTGAQLFGAPAYLTPAVNDAFETAGARNRASDSVLPLVHEGREVGAVVRLTDGCVTTREELEQHYGQPQAVSDTE